MGQAAPQAAQGTGRPAAYGEITADMLRATFDHWRIWESGHRWFAGREGDFKPVGPESLIHPLVSANSVDGLADQLTMQEWLRARSAAELEAVWRDGFASVPLAGADEP